ncbi:unnamed protein product [Phaeothamnion confervicola]
MDPRCLFVVVTSLWSAGGFVPPLGRPQIRRCPAPHAEARETVESWDDLSGGRGGCFKRIMRAGRPEEAAPPTGARVRVHYTIQVAETGAEIDSSRAKGEPFEFFLGRWPSEAMFGWDKALATMRRGELAAVRCGPRYAYGERGAPPKIPPNATLDCELELLDWVDLAARYNAAPGESDEARLARWKREVADGTSPMREEAGIDRQVQAATVVDVPSSTAPAGTGAAAVAATGNAASTAGAAAAVSLSAGAGAAAAGPAAGTAAGDAFGVRAEPTLLSGAGAGGAAGARRGCVIVSPDTPEGRRTLQRQVAQGYADRMRWREDGRVIDVYVPVPDGTAASDVHCEIGVRRLRLALAGPTSDATVAFEPIEGELEGAVRLDGSYWFLTDVALAPANFGGQGGGGSGGSGRGSESGGAAAGAAIELGAMVTGETCVQLHLEKRPPDDVIWARVLKRTDEEEREAREEADRLRRQALAVRAAAAADSFGGSGGPREVFGGGGSSSGGSAGGGG